MIKLMTLALPAALLCASCAGAGADSSMPAASTGEAADAAAQPMTAMGYVTAASASDLFEIQSSQIALQKAQSPEVRAFAQMMVDQHTKTTADLAAAAQQAGITPPPPTLPADKADKVESLRNAAGAAFDAMYMREQVAGHQEALALHEGYARNGDQPALRTAAQKMAPIVSTHLERAQALARPG